MSRFGMGLGWQTKNVMNYEPVYKNDTRKKKIK